jgi:hypothetical protein
MPVDDEERERRRARALQLVAEGRFGGAKYGRLGGRPRKLAKSELAVLLSELDEGSLLDQLVETALGPHTRSAAGRIKAIETLFRMSREARDRSVQRTIRLWLAEQRLRRTDHGDRRG